MSAISELPKILKAGIKKHNVPGATIAIYRNGRVTQSAAGVLNVDTKVSATTDSLFQIGSITKVFTATLIMQLVDEGKVDIDQPLRAYLPDFAVADADVSARVTLRHLLCHTSGIEGDFFVDSGRGEDSIARLQDMGRLLPQIFPPGERFAYCNYGFAMLGRVIEVVAGDTYDIAIKKRIYEPLGMNNALALPEDALRFRCAIGHVPHPRKKGVNVLTTNPWMPYFGLKAAGCTASMAAEDLLKFVGLHLRGGVTKDGTRILSRAGVRAMQRRHVKLPRYAPLGTVGWGLGWTLYDWTGVRVIGHSGNPGNGQSSFLHILPEKNLAIALLTNGGDALGLLETVCRATFDKLARADMPANPDPNENLYIDPSRIIGCYENLNGIWEISCEDDVVKAELKAKGVLTEHIPPMTVRFIDRNTACPEAGSGPLGSMTFTFEGDDPRRPDFLGWGYRLYRRCN